MTSIRLCIILFTIALALNGQTRVDVQRQGKGTEFLAPPFAKPLRSGTTLPLTCARDELFFLTTAVPGANIHVCYEDGAWAPQGSAGQANVTLLSDGILAGARPTINLVSGNGLSQIVTVLPSQLNVQQSLETAVLMTNAGNQSGGTLLCASSGGVTTAYTCGLQPMLQELTAGMVIHWRPDVTSGEGPLTLEIDGLGPIALRLADGISAPRTGDFHAGRLYPVWYDGAVLRVLESPLVLDYQTVAGEQSGAALYCQANTASGSNYGCSMSPPIMAYVTGMVIRWRPDVSSTGGPTTLAVNTLSQIPLKLADGLSDPQTGELRANELYSLWFDGSSFRIADFLPGRVLLKSEFQAGLPIFCVSGSTVGQNFLCPLTPGLPAYNAGLQLRWLPDVNAAGGAASLNVNGLGSIPLKRSDGITNPKPGDFRAGEMEMIWFDGSNFRLVSSKELPTGTGVRPACDSERRGTVWLVPADLGQADSLAVCAKDALDAFDWRSIYE